MSFQNNGKAPRHTNAVVIGSVLALLTILTGGFFLILNTLVEKESMIGEPTVQVSEIAASETPHTNTGTSTSTPNIPLTITAINIEEHPSFTLYWDHTIWENVVDENVKIEDFEKESLDQGQLRFPYLTGNGFLLTGQSEAQILHGTNLINDSSQIHFRDWENGLTFIFPDGALVSAFGFDYKASETWQLKFDDAVITIPKGSKGFIGIVMKTKPLNEFNLYSLERTQGGMTVDNITYILKNLP